MKTAPQIVIGKTRSLLANSSPEILKPIPGCDGVFQVVWIDQINTHGLFYQHKCAEGAQILATHHNGYSCDALAERIIKGDSQRALEQLDFIADCGGTKCSNEKLLSIIQLA